MLTDPWVIGFLAVGALLRVVYALSSHMPSDIGDQIQYLQFGRSFEDWWMSTDALRTPGYPLLIAINHNLGLGEDALRSSRACS